MTSSRITVDELKELFGDDIPILVAKLLRYDPLSNDEMRHVLRRLAPARHEPKYEHPGYQKPYPLSTVLADLASQEGCDGEPYDAMMFAAQHVAHMSSELDDCVRTKTYLRERVEWLSKNGVTTTQAVVEGTLRGVLQMLEGKK